MASTAPVKRPRAAKRDVEDTHTLARERLREALKVVAHEARHLRYSLGRVEGEPLDAAWVRGLEGDPERAERLDAFVARYGRMQDTMGGRLLRWLLEALAERPETQLDRLQRAEALGLIDSAARWMEARALRNRMIHEYVDDPEELAANLRRACALAEMLLETHRRIARFAAERLGVEAGGHG